MDLLAKKLSKNLKNNSYFQSVPPMEVERRNVLGDNLDTLDMPGANNENSMKSHDLYKFGDGFNTVCSWPWRHFLQAFILYRQEGAFTWSFAISKWETVSCSGGRSRLLQNNHISQQVT